MIDEANCPPTLPCRKKTLQKRFSIISVVKDLCNNWWSFCGHLFILLQPTNTNKMKSHLQSVCKYFISPYINLNVIIQEWNQHRFLAHSHRATLRNLKAFIVCFQSADLLQRPIIILVALEARPGLASCYHLATLLFMAAGDVICRSRGRGEEKVFLSFI